MNIGQIIREKENNYTTGTIKIGKHVDISQYEIVENIIAYLNSKHLSGLKDSLGREKPFFNIVTSAVNIWYRATDIDRKNIRFKATKEADYKKSFIASLLLQEWMRKVNFGRFLNEWGRTLSQYGSAIVKFVEKKGELYPVNIAWNKIIVDPIDFENNVKIEKYYLTASQLQENPNYDQDQVKALITEKSKESRKGLNKETSETNNANYFEIYELHGKLPLSELTNEDTDVENVQQMHVISYLVDKKGKVTDFSLYKGKEEKDPYILTHLIKEEGRTLGIGAVESLFDAQWMVNHSVKQTKDMLDLASKMFFQTADQSFTGTNAIQNIETGDILINDGNPITMVNNSALNTTAVQNFGQLWQNLGKEITSTPDAIRGNSFPSGTAYRQVAMLNQEANSLFELMTENKGLHLEEMLRTFVIPHLRKKIDTQDEISAYLDMQGLQKLDKWYIDAEVTRRSNSRIKDAMLKKNDRGGEIAQPLNELAERQSIQDELNDTGNQRFLRPSKAKTWKESLDNLEYDLEVEITGETVDKQAVFETMTNLFQVIVGNQGQPLSPEAQLVFNKIMEEAGRISPIELSAVKANSPQGVIQPQQPQPNPMDAQMVEALSGIK